MASAAAAGNASPDNAVIDNALSRNALSGNALPPNVSAVVVPRPRRVAYWCPLMAFSDVWVFRIVHQDTGKPAQGVPVTVLDRAGNAAGHWVSDADGLVAVPRRDISKLRLRVGLRSEDPIRVTPVAAVPRLSVTDSRTTQPGPMTSFVCSPRYFKS